MAKCCDCKSDPCCCKQPAAPDPCSDMPVTDWWQSDEVVDYLRGMRVFRSVDSCGRETMRCKTVILSEDTIRDALGGGGGGEGGEVSWGGITGTIGNQIDLIELVGEAVDAAIAQANAYTDALNVPALQTLSGMPPGSLTLGLFTGDIISDFTNVKAALQQLETAIEAGGEGGGNCQRPQEELPFGPTITADLANTSRFEVSLTDDATFVVDNLEAGNSFWLTVYIDSANPELTWPGGALNFPDTSIYVSGSWIHMLIYSPDGTDMLVMAMEDFNTN